MSLLDRHQRPLGSLRISVTDRCNLRCSYCMPAAAYRWLPAESLLDFDEITTLSRIFVGLGVSKLRITGGEPLLRPGLDRLVRSLATLDGVEDLALTTNATRLARHAGELRQAGLDRLTISLDTLNPQKMKRLSRYDRSLDVAKGVDAAVEAGFESVKLNTVVIRGSNDDELTEIVKFAAARGIEPRFIEYMDVGGASDWNAESVVSGHEILERLAVEFGPASAISRGLDPSAPASRWRLADGTVIGIVSSTTEPFCGSCDRSRLTADGTWFRCLYAGRGTDLALPLRSGVAEAELTEMVRDGWKTRDDRGAEARLAAPDRGALVSITRLKADPKLEMHVRGG